MPIPPAEWSAQEWFLPVWDAAKPRGVPSIRVKGAPAVDFYPRPYTSFVSLATDPDRVLSDPYAAAGSITPEPFF